LAGDLAATVHALAEYLGRILATGNLYKSDAAKHA
jgi:hypothetical protein